MSNPKRVAIIFPYFAHYREPKIHALINDGKHHYEFLGGTSDFGLGIQLVDQFPKNRFRKIVVFKIRSIVFMIGAVWPAISFRYDCIILWGNYQWPMMWIAAILARMRGKRVLFFTHGWIRRDRGLKRLIRNTFYRLGHGLLLYGHRAKCIGIENGFDQSKLHVIYNSLDVAKQDRVREQFKPSDRQRTRRELFGVDSENPILVNITRLHHYKKVDMLILAAAKLNAQSNPVNVLIIGEGPHRPELEKIVAENGVHAVFAGALYDEYEIGKMLNASDLAVMPGPVGLLVMHALAYGVPVISNDNFDRQMPEFEAIIPGVTGDFFVSDDLHSLTETLDRLLKGSMTYEERYAKSREVIERFYNPRSQRVIYDRAVDGFDADDLFIAGLGRYTDGPDLKDSPR